MFRITCKIQLGIERV